MKTDTKKKNKKDNECKCLSLKRRIIPNDNLVHFIRHNSNKRRKLWNKFVEAYYEYGDNGLYFNSKDANLLREYFVHKDRDQIKQLKDSDADDVMRTMYCSDIPLSVYDDVCMAFTSMIARWKRDHKLSRLRYKKYDPFIKRFRVKARNSFANGIYPSGKVHFMNPYTFEFRASVIHVRNEYRIDLKEPIADSYDRMTYTFVVKDKRSGKVKYTFRHDDIKDISFSEEMGKFYVTLTVEPTYYRGDINKKHRDEVAGIDLGIHNPVTIYDGDPHDIVTILKIDDKNISRMQYYERKARRLQRVMDHKYYINKVKHWDNPDYPKYSKRYRKIQKHFRRLWRKITNIRKNWRYKAANYITKTYKTIIVDEYRTPDNSKKKELSNKQKRRYNHYNRQHAMYLFMEALRYMAVKNKCKYVEAPKRTTRTCSKCKHVNEKLPLGVEYLTCCNCGTVIQRDVNAAINCYDAYFKNR